MGVEFEFGGVVYVGVVVVDDYDGVVLCFDGFEVCDDCGECSVGVGFDVVVGYVDVVVVC